MARGGASRLTSYSKGFTLAEVLITLGIIGIVAALTIPTLISNYRKKVVESRLVNFYSVMNQAIKLSEVDNGSIMTWEKLEKGYETDEDGNPDYNRTNALLWFNKYLKPYLKTIKIESPNNTITGYLKIYMPDGGLAVFSASSIIYYPNAADYKETASTSDPDFQRNNPEDSGTRYFTFFFAPWKDGVQYKYHYQRGMEPYMYNWDGDKESLLTDSTYGCKKDIGTNERAYCTKLIQMNSWKIPDDYPLKF